MVKHVTDDQIPWTTARCNRLLRPISSRLTALRKAADNARTQKPEPRKEQAKEEECQAALTSPRRRTWKKTSDTKDDLEWVPEAKPLRTYKATSRPGRHVRTPMRPKSKPPMGPPGEINVPTPFIARTLQHIEESPRYISPQQAPQRGRKPLHVQQKEHLKAVRKQTSTDTFAHISGAYAGLEKVLEATAAYGPERERKGTRSLRATCLRQVPAYIELEEYWQKEEDDDDTEDAAVRIYDDIEHLALRDENGRQALGHVVRASAIKMVTEALRDTVLPQTLLLELAKLCTKTKAWDAGEEMLSVALMTLQPNMQVPNHPQDDIFEEPDHAILSLFRNYVESSGSWSLFYRTMANLLRSGKLPVEWMATKAILPIWAKIIKSINSHESSLGPALELLDVVLLRSFGLAPPNPCTDSESQWADHNATEARRNPVKPSVRGALNNTVNSMLTIFTCAGLSGTSTQGEDQPYPGRYLRLLHYFCQSFSIELAKTKKSRMPGGPQSVITTHTERACTLLVADLLLSTSDPYSMGISEHLIPRIGELRRLATGDFVKNTSVIDAISKVLNSIARSYGHVTQKDHFDTLKGLLQSLTIVSASAEPKNVHFMDRIVYRAAIEFSENSQDNVHFQYAKSLEKTMKLSGHGLTLDVPSSESSEDPEPTSDSGSEGDEQEQGYRWEEGIEEWIMCTPAAVARKGAKNLDKPLVEDEPESSLSSSLSVSTPVVERQDFQSREMSVYECRLEAVSPSRHYMSPQVVIYTRPILAPQPTLPRKRPSLARKISLAESPTSSGTSSIDSDDESDESVTSVSEDDSQQTRHQQPRNTKKRSFAQVMRDQRAKRRRTSLETSCSDNSDDNEEEAVEQDDIQTDDDLRIYKAPVRRSKRVSDMIDLDTSFSSTSTTSSRRSCRRPTRGLKSQTSYTSVRQDNRKSASKSTYHTNDILNESASEEDELIMPVIPSRSLRATYSHKTRADTTRPDSRSKERAHRAIRRLSAARGAVQTRMMLDDEMSGDELSF
ncbi:hypothetical protein EJ05DRAFT_476198 [Pseudovirgaria hyperparasitica]|uniref:Uncharacterized protein n=1 Tax=Pseudovirgaria hyperparasitica TaxID=470096 RepID=A0A6A6W7A6_9PEZI|nr:uncharacterized protein EJ05DRAFT_476198 [Pseudovirgaria hyperparasitica]KAF2757904.1 hypothetical protein EJ05DRAFT_476198 [Pseudovirgaria hyperparasitica]